MRFVLANSALFLLMAMMLGYQYFFQSPYEDMPAHVSVGMSADNPGGMPGDVVTTAGVRTPAATPSVLPASSLSMSPTEKILADSDWKFSLSCKDSEKEMSPKRDFVILNLKKCGKQFPKDIAVENQSNGFTASVFVVSDSHSKTDAIPLRKGKNVITIRYLLAKGKTSVPKQILETLVLQRE